jgi:hypothetical protein
MRNKVSILLVIMALPGLFLTPIAWGDVDSDASYMLDWFNRTGPQLDFPDVPGSLAWQGGLDQVLWLSGSFLEINNNGGTDSVTLEGPGASAAWDPSASPVLVAQLDFRIDSLSEDQPTQFGPSLSLFTRNGSGGNTYWYPEVRCSRDPNDAPNEFSLHVYRGTQASDVFHEEEGLILGRWYRLTEKFSDITSQITYYLQDLDTPGTQTTFYQHVKVGFFDESTLGFPPNALFMSGGRSIATGVFNALMVGQEGTRPTEPPLECGIFGFFPGDLDHNCVVDEADLALLAAVWLNCTDPLGPGNCVKNVPEVTANTMGYWRFEEASGQALDLSANARHGDLNGGAARSATVFGSSVPQTSAANAQSMEFFGSDGDAVNMGNGFNVDDDDFTLEAYVNLRDAFSFPLIAGKLVGGNFLDRGFELQGRPDAAHGNGEAGPGKWKALFRSRDGGNSDDLFSADLNYNTWYHLAAVRNGATLSLYVDGVLAGSKAISNSGSYTSGQEFSVGGANTTGGPPGDFGRAVNGYVDEVRLSNIALTPSQFLNVQ